MNTASLCPGCGARMVLPGATPQGALLACPRCATLFPLPPPRPAEDGRVVVVAHESEELLAAARAALSEAGFHAVVASDGAAARAAVSEHRPQCLVLDVALPGAFAFQWIPELRGVADTRELRVLLVSSVYDKTAYKRRPTDLHGADDYVELHHVPDSLVPKVKALLAGVPAPPPVHRPPDAVERRRGEQVEAASRAREERLRSSDKPALSVARLVLADLHLYEGAEIQRSLLEVARQEIRVRLGPARDEAAIEAALGQAVEELGGRIVE